MFRPPCHSRVTAVRGGDRGRSVEPLRRPPVPPPDRPVHMSGPAASSAEVPQQRPGTAEAPDPVAMLRSPAYLRLLVLAAALGVPIAAAAYFFLSLVSHLQKWVFADLPTGLGFDTAPPWWPLLPLTLAGVLVAATIRYLPGNGGHVPVDGLHPGGPPASNREI